MSVALDPTLFIGVQSSEDNVQSDPMGRISVLRNTRK